MKKSFNTWIKDFAQEQAREDLERNSPQVRLGIPSYAAILKFNRHYGVLSPDQMDLFFQTYNKTLREEV